MQALRGLVIVVVALLASGGARAAEDLGAAAKACRSESDEARRLACYDRAVDRTKPATAAAAPAAATAGTAAAPSAPPAAAASTATVTAPPAATAQDNFGRERQMAYEEDKRREEESRATGELRATILEIEKRMDGLLTFKLDNGQVWRQNTPDSRFRAKTGDRVLIQPGSLNSFILSTPSKKSTRVTRVK